MYRYRRFRKRMSSTPEFQMFSYTLCLGVGESSSNMNEIENTPGGQCCQNYHENYIITDLISFCESFSLLQLPRNTPSYPFERCFPQNLEHRDIILKCGCDPVAKINRRQ